MNIRLLASALRKCHRCSRLDFGCNRFCDREAQELSGALAGMCNLTVLCLDSNHISRDECLAIESLLENTMSKLEELYLGKNDIDVECVNILTNA